MIEQPFFSVIIPLYNKAKYIKNAIRSILQQSYDNYEIIVIDDGSTDRGPDIVNKINNYRIRLSKQDNQGVSAARNTGIENARYEIIAFLDADDEWMPGHLEVLTRLAIKYPEAAAYATAYQIKEKHGQTRVLNFKAIPPLPWEGIIPDYFKSVSSGPELIWTSAVAVRKGIFKNIGNFNIGLKNGEDADMWLRIALEYPIVFSSEVTAVYNLEDENSAANRTKEEADFKSQYFIEWPKKKKKEDSYLNEYIAKKQLILLTELFLSGYGKSVCPVLKQVKTKLHKKAKLRLYIKTLLGKKILSILGRMKRKLIKDSDNNISNGRFT